jgi:hypothetical protein
MSKTAQRKREYYNQGMRDFKAYGRAYTPFFRDTHPFNLAYMDGYYAAMQEKTRAPKPTLLQWFRDRFVMEA